MCATLDELREQRAVACWLRPAPRRYFTGFRNPVTGALRELRYQSTAIARAVGST